MDTYSVFSCSSTRRDATRLVQDLKSIRRSSMAASDRPATSQDVPIRSADIHQLKLKPHIGVIGAGIAGLRCADILLQHGFQVTILEGRDRLGGRLYQERLPNGHLVDMGPNWIHGSIDNPILDLVRETGTITSSHVMDEHGSELTGALFSSDGSLLPLADGVVLSTLMWTIVEEAFVHSNKHCAEIDPAESLLDFFLQRLPVHVPDNTKDWESRRTRILQLADLWGAFVGSPATAQSLKYFWLEECIEGENLFCAGTYQKTLEKMTEAVQQATIQLGQTVTSVVSRTDEKKSAGGGVSVTTASGSAFVFDELVFTAPLGWLKQNHAATFEPPLPARLASAIDSIGYGCLEKVYISFATAFWKRPDDETGRVVRGFCQWLAPGVYAQPANSGCWPQEAVDLSVMPPSTAHPTLLFYIFGEQSRHITDTLAALRKEEGVAADKDEGEQVQKQHSFLVDYFHPYFSRLPHYDAAEPTCQPTACLATSWLHDDLAGNGSYSNFQVGLKAGDEDVRAMREGLPDRGLWLAGEHTAPFVALGTATGAFWSGESVGRRIAEAHGRKEV